MDREEVLAVFKEYGRESDFSPYFLNCNLLEVDVYLDGKSRITILCGEEEHVDIDKYYFAVGDTMFHFPYGTIKGILAKWRGAEIKATQGGEIP